MIINYLSFFFFLILFNSTSIVNMGLPSHSILKSSFLADKKDKRWYIPMYGKHLIYFLHWLHQQDNTDYSIQCVSLTLGPSIYIEIYILCQSYNSTHKCNWNPIFMETNTPQTFFMDRLILIWQIFKNLIRMTQYLWFKSMHVKTYWNIKKKIFHIRVR